MYERMNDERTVVEVRVEDGESEQADYFESIERIRGVEAAAEAHELGELGMRERDQVGGREYLSEQQLVGVVEAPRQLKAERTVHHDEQAPDGHRVAAIADRRAHRRHEVPHLCVCHIRQQARDIEQQKKEEVS